MSFFSPGQTVSSNCKTTPTIVLQKAGYVLELGMIRLKARTLWAPAANNSRNGKVIGSAAIWRMLRRTVAPVTPDRLRMNSRIADQFSRSHQKQSPLSLMIRIFADMLAARTHFQRSRIASPEHTI